MALREALGSGLHRPFITGEYSTFLHSQMWDQEPHSTDLYEAEQDEVLRRLTQQFPVQWRQLAVAAFAMHTEAGIAIGWGFSGNKKHRTRLARLALFLSMTYNCGTQCPPWLRAVRARIQPQVSQVYDAPASDRPITALRAGILPPFESAAPAAAQEPLLEPTAKGRSRPQASAASHADNADEVSPGSSNHIPDDVLQTRLQSTVVPATQAGVPPPAAAAAAQAIAKGGPPPAPKGGPPPAPPPPVRADPRRLQAGAPDAQGQEDPAGGGHRGRPEYYPRGHPFHAGPRLLVAPYPPWTEICRKFNRSECSAVGAPCPWRREHVCSRCGRGHEAVTCDTPEDELPPMDPAQGPPPGQLRQWEAQRGRR